MEPAKTNENAASNELPSPSLLELAVETLREELGRQRGLTDWSAVDVLTLGLSRRPTFHVGPRVEVRGLYGLEFLKMWRKGVVVATEPVDGVEGSCRSWGHPHLIGRQADSTDPSIGPVGAGGAALPVRTPGRLPRRLARAGA